MRQQLQVKTGKGGAGSTRWYLTLAHMVKQEGALSVYKGLSAR